MKLRTHIITSLSAGALLWLFTKSLYAGILCFITGFLIDLDHIVEYIIHYGWKDFTLNKLFLACEQTVKSEGEEGFSKLHLVFHIGEFALLLWIASIYTKNIYLIAISIGYSLHLILDCAGNPLYPHFYFFILRAVKGFRSKELYAKTKYN